MLGILLIFFIGKYFYKLAEEHDKSKWGFAILGIASYYAGTFITGILLGVFLVIIGSEEFLDTTSELALGLIVLPFGMLASYLLYKALERTWRKAIKVKADEIDMIGKNSEE